MEDVPEIPMEVEEAEEESEEKVAAIQESLEHEIIEPATKISVESADAVNPEPSDFGEAIATVENNDAGPIADNSTSSGQITMESAEPRSGTIGDNIIEPEESHKDGEVDCDDKDEIVPESGSEVADDDNISSEACEQAEVAPVPLFWEYNFDSETNPFCLSVTSSDEFASSEFLKGCKWMPDGSCLLTNSDDSKLRLFNFPENVGHVEDWKNVSTDTVPSDNTWKAALTIREGGLIYDYNWYPFASSLDPSTTVFLATSKDSPIHLWDACYGHLRATYLAYNDVDEPIHAYSVAFDASGENIYAGYDKSIRIFNIARPGRQCTLRKLNSAILPDLNQHGLISCFAFNPAWSNVYACGSYRKTIGLYMEDGTAINVLEGHVGGITHLAFSHDGTKLYSGARSDSTLICWDLRNMKSEYRAYKREVKTQQRIYFELSMDDKYLISGGTDGLVRIWDTTIEDHEEPLKVLRCDTDCINGVSINPYVPVLATASGQRKLDEVVDDSDDDSFVVPVPKHKKVGNVKLWKL